jgi:hypothetical protein
MRGEAVQRLAGMRMQADRVFGDRQRRARAAHFDRVHIAIDPDAGPHVVGVGTDRQQPQVAARRRLADRFEPHDLRVRRRPGADLRRQFVVVEVLLAKSACHGPFTAR